MTDALRARVALLEGWLRGIERQARILCPECKEYGFHAPDCELAKALRPVAGTINCPPSEYQRKP